MWYKMIEQSHFLNSLYNQIPKLENVCIEGIYIKEEGRKATLHFDMPFYAENIPKNGLVQGTTQWSFGQEEANSCPVF